jgi:hypothetical protein
MTDLDPTRQPQGPPPAADLAASATRAPTTPVVRPERPARPGGSRLRWAIALVVTAAVVVGAGVATVLMTGQSADPDVLAWTPEDSVMYAELRLDLPGDQEAELAKVLAAFPGFDDQAAFTGKLGEALDRLVGEATDGAHDYRTWIDPWFGGALALSMAPPPGGTAGAEVEPRVLLLASVDDADGAAAWADALLRESGAASSTETYESVTITILSPAGSGDAARPPVAYAVLGPVLAIGDPASVRASIDTNGSSGLGAGEAFRAAVASVPGDRLGFAFVDTAALMKAAGSMSGELGVDADASFPPLIADLTAPWMAASMRAADGDLVVETRSPHLDAMGPAAVGTSVLAGLVPPDTLFLATEHDVGASIERARELASADPEIAKGLEELESGLALLGGLDAVTGWIGDAGVAVVPDGDAASGGLLVVPDDRAAADRLLTTLRGFLSLAGGNIQVRDEAYGSATITILDLGDLGSLTGDLGDGAGDLPSGSLEVAYSVTDEVVVLGVGPAFVRAVLDAREGSSLADQARFSGLLDRAGARHASLVWLDVAGIRELAEGMIPADERTSYEREIRPYLQALDAVIGASVPGGDIDRSTVIFSMAD